MSGSNLSAPVTTAADDILRDAHTLQRASLSAWANTKRMRLELRGLKASIKHLEAALRTEETGQKAAAARAKEAAPVEPAGVVVAMPRRGAPEGDRYIADGLCAMAGATS